MPTSQPGPADSPFAPDSLSHLKQRRGAPPAWLRDLSSGFVFAFCLSLLSCQNSCNSGQTPPQGYSCGNLAGSAGQPCFATIDYASGTPEGADQFFPKLFGFRTTVAIPNTIIAGDGLLGNSLRLSSGSTNSFLEVGYASVNISQSISCPTGGGLTYMAQQIDNGIIIINCLMSVPSSDVGQNIVLEISSTGTDLTKSSSFRVTISAPSGTIDVCGQQFHLRCSTMLWTSGGPEFAIATLGQTLRGSSGAAATTTAFVQNSFEVSDGVFAFEGGQSDVLTQNPPFGGELQAATVPGSQGGTFFTECCLSPSTVFPGQLNFGTVAVGNTLTKTILVTNVQPSSGNLNITSIGISGTNASEFTMPSTCGSSLPPLASCTVTVNFKPTAQGTRTANFSISDNGGSANSSGSDQATLVGTGG
jgi:hypothetical protein